MFGDAGYQGVEKRDETQGIVVDWHVAMRPGKRRALDKASVLGKLQDEVGYAMQLRQDSAKSTLVNRLKMQWSGTGHTGRTQTYNRHCDEATGSLRGDIPPCSALLRVDPHQLDLVSTD